MTKVKRTTQELLPSKNQNVELINLLLAENKKLKSEIKLFQTKLDQATKSYDWLQHHFKQLQRHQFGRKSERFIDSNNPQANLFTDIELPTNNESNNDDEEANNIIHIAAHNRKKRNHSGFPDNLPCREVLIEAMDRICSCGKEKKLIRYEITELLHYVPAVFEVIVQKREVLGCPGGCSSSVTIAPNPKRILPKTSVTDSLVAYTIVSKLYDRQPCCRFIIS